MKGWIFAAVIFLGGCASSSDEVGSIYVSPLAYQQYNCQQIGQEAERVSRRAAEIAGVQDSKATSDAVMTGVGLVLFWPSSSSSRVTAIGGRAWPSEGRV